MDPLTGRGGYRVDGADRRVAAAYVTAVALAAVALVLAAWPTRRGSLLAGASPWWPALAGPCCGALFAVLPLRRAAPEAAVVVGVLPAAAGCWVALGWSGAGGRDYWLALAVGWLLGTAAAAVFATPTDWGDPARAAVSGRTPVPAVPAEEWSAGWLETVTQGKVRGAHSITRESWETGHGYTVTGSMPPDGTTWEVLQSCEGRLAAALRLPPGGGVTVGPGEDSAGWVCKVLEVDAMANPPAYPGLEAVQ